MLKFVINELTYHNYVHNRRLSPQVLPEEWGKLECFREWQAMEERFQAESRREDAAQLEAQRLADLEAGANQWSQDTGREDDK